MFGWQSLSLVQRTLPVWEGEGEFLQLEHKVQSLTFQRKEQKKLPEFFAEEFSLRSLYDA